MKLFKFLAPLWVAAVLLLACSAAPTYQIPTAPVYTDAVSIVLSDSQITVDGKAAATDAASAVYTANDIVYYESGKNFTYGEGSEKDAHSAQDAAAHTVVHITKPGAYRISGKLSLGQIAVDLGDGAKNDPDAVVILILNGVDITCQVAPAVIFYNVYECGSDDEEKATKDVDTSAAGANVIIADGTVNTVSGSYVARIYKPDSVILNGNKTAVVDAKKLHKYDGAFYSKRSMNIFGEKENTGILNIKAENEGLDSELHLSINGGNIHIESGNDGINTNEDGVSVTAINGGTVTIRVTGETGEGDGIDSNGWLVIHGGTVIAAACAQSADAGIDSDMGIHILGGTVIASGHMLDRIEEAGQNYAVFQFAQKQTGGETIALKRQDGKAILETEPQNAYSIFIYSSPDLKDGTYSLWCDGKQLAGISGGAMAGPGMKPDGGNRPESPDQGQMPPEGFTPPDGNKPPEKPGGSQPGEPGTNNTQAASPDFTIHNGGNMFNGIQPLEN